MNVQDITVDLSKKNVKPESIVLRQGDKSGTTLRVNVLDNGVNVSSLSGYTAKFIMKLPYNRFYYEVEGTISGSMLTFVIDESYAAVQSGVTNIAYVALVNGETTKMSANNVRVEILPSALDGFTPPPEWTDPIDEFFRESEAILRASINEYGADVEALMEQARQDVADAVESADAATERAIAAAEAAEGIILQDIPTMTKTIKGGAMLGVGLDVSDERLNIDLSDSGSGSSVLTNGCALLDAEGDGWAEQDTTTGKNLLDESLFGILDSVLKPIQIALPDGTYTISSTCPLDASSANILVGAGYLTSYSGMTTANSGVHSGQSRTLQPADGYITVFCRKNAIYNLHDYQTQLEAGSTSTAYEPYTGGKPSPSPEYPQEVRVAKGRNLIPIEAGKTDSRNSVSSTVNEDGGVSLAGTASSEGDLYLYGGWGASAKPLNLTVGGTYTISITTPKSGVLAKIYCFDSSNAVTGSSTTSGGRATFTVPANTVKCGVSVRVQSGVNVDGVTVFVQIEAGSTATSYVPYGHVGLEIKQGSTLIDCIPVPIPSDGLAALPDGTHDTLAIDSAGHVVVEKHVGKIVYDGVTNRFGTTSAPTGSNIGYRTASVSKIPDVLISTTQTDVVKVKSSHFTANVNTLTSARWAIGDCCIYNGNFYCVTSMQTMEELNTWFQSNPVTVYYPLATTTIVDLGYIDLPLMPDGCTVSIPELRNIGVEWLVTGADGVPEMALDERKRTLYEISLAGDAELSNVAPIENGKASANYAVGSYLVHGGTLYRVTTAIATGETITPGSNVTATTVMAELIALTA